MGLLTCQLSGIKEYNDFIVYFHRDMNERNIMNNVGVGSCYSRSSHMEHHGMKIYYNTKNESCVMKLPASVDQQDAGIYHCSVQIMNHVNNEKINMYSKNWINVLPSPQTPLVMEITIPLATVVIAVICMALILLVVKKLPRARGDPGERLPLLASSSSSSSSLPSSSSTSSRSTITLLSSTDREGQSLV